MYTVHSFVKNRFLMIYYATNFKVKILLDQFVSWKYSKIIPVRYFIFSESIFFLKDKNQVKFFFSTHFAIRPISYGEKNNSKLLTSISWSNDPLRSYIWLPGGAQTHMMTHTQREPCARPRTPCAEKNIFKTIKIFSISD